jgi:predicted glycogen debranching enzyme
MEGPLRIGWRRGDPREALLSREWLVANGLGGYGSGTLAGVCTRRFHGLLVAALPPPHGRVMMLNHMGEQLLLADGSSHVLSGFETMSGEIVWPDPDLLDEVALDAGLPVWRYVHAGVALEKRVLLPHGRNTVYVLYHLLAAPSPVRVILEPGLFIRPHEAKLAVEPPISYPISQSSDRADGWEILAGSGYPPLQLRIEGAEASATLEGRITDELMYREERCRGYDYHGRLYVPGRFEMTLAPGQRASLIATIERDATVATADEALQAERARRSALIYAAHPAVRSGIGAELVLAADQFIIQPRAHEEGDKGRTIIAGYPWFTDWGRDTMISLEGLTLLTSRHAEAGNILRTFARHVKDGLIPNMFPEGESEGLYHTADATMWFFHAIDRYIATTGDKETLRLLLPTLKNILHHHMKGTRFGIRVDPDDGLLTQGAEGYQLTWMDAKVDGWVVTPRRGKAVEINALFYNALRVLEGWVRAENGDEEAAPIAAHADKVRASFNRRFWYAEGKHLYDVVDGEQGDDPSLRPNQILAIGLPNAVLDRSRWEAVVAIVREKLLTPVGLRSLSPDHPDYKSVYDGDLRARDAAYHQGTVWGWLVGPFLDAWLRVHPGDRAGARQLVEGFAPHLSEACLGTVSEIFDAEAPYVPRGCVAQAWSVAEALRVVALCTR